MKIKSFKPFSQAVKHFSMVLKPCSLFQLLHRRNYLRQSQAFAEQSAALKIQSLALKIESLGLDFHSGGLFGESLGLAEVIPSVQEVEQAAGL